MKRFTLLVSAMAVAVATLVAAGPAAQSADARKVRIDHPSDPGWATYNGSNKIAVCDNQKDGHDTYVRYWLKEVPGRKPPRSQPIPEGPIFDPEAALISARDTFGRLSGRRRVPQFCTYEPILGFPPIAFSVCVTGGEKCSRVRRLAN